MQFYGSPLSLQHCIILGNNSTAGHDRKQLVPSRMKVANAPNDTLTCIAFWFYLFGIVSCWLAPTSLDPASDVETCFLRL